jgi:DNA-binding response OmpR family regulator
MSAATEGGPVTVLVVEDEAGTRSFFVTVLRTEGFTVLDAGDGASAAKAAERFGVPVQLLVTDFILPDTNGHEVAERLRKRNPGMKVLIVSAHVDEVPVQKAIMEEAFKKGAAFLQKPFGAEELVRKVRAVLRGLSA